MIEAPALERVRSLVLLPGTPSLDQCAVYWLVSQIDSDMASWSALRPGPSARVLSDELTPSSLAALGYLGSSLPDVDTRAMRAGLTSVLAGSARTLERMGWADNPLIAAGLLLLARALELDEQREQILAERHDLYLGGSPGVRVVVCLVFEIPLDGQLPLDQRRVGSIAANYLACRLGLVRDSSSAKLATILAKVSAAGSLAITRDFDGVLTLGALELVVADGAARPQRTQPEQVARPIRVLWIGALAENTSDLKLRQEQSRLEELADERLRFEFEMSGTSLRLDRRLARGQFSVLHVSAHGVDDSIILEEETGISRPVSYSMFVNYLTSFGPPDGPLECVVLSCCLPESATREPSACPFTRIVMSDEVADASSIEFALSFYRQLAGGASHRAAYERARKYVRTMVQDPSFDVHFIEPAG